jgi:hypothetical protein
LSGGWSCSRQGNSPATASKVKRTAGHVGGIGHANGRLQPL